MSNLHDNPSDKLQDYSSIRSEFVDIVNTAKALFSWQKEMGVKSLDISKKSLSTIRLWDKNWDKDRQVDIKKLRRKENQLSHKKNQAYKEDKFANNSINKVNKYNDAPNNNAINNDASNNKNRQIKTSDEDSIEPFLYFEGDSNAKVLFLFDVEVSDENQKPDPYKGAVGELFLRILKAMNFTRETVFTCAFTKLSPIKLNSIQDKDVSFQKLNTIRKHVKKKIKQVNPEVIATLGNSALQLLLGNDASFTYPRGNFHVYQEIALMPSFHPSLLLKDISKKRDVWNDMKKIMSRLRL